MNVKAADIFTTEWAGMVFSPERTDDFFEALFGGAEEGAYTISLRFLAEQGNSYTFAFDLTQRPGKCLSCNLTYGLPQVFSRHPVLNVKGVAEAVAVALGKDPAGVAWKLEATREESSARHSIPFIVTVN
jgi:hypothetical protein